MNKKYVLLFLLLSLCFVGCNKEIKLETQKPKENLRVVSLAPNITNIIMALGGEDFIVGVTKYCQNPNKKWTEIGGYMDFNKETFMSLKPNLVFLASYHTEAIEICEKQGIEYVSLDLDSFRSIRPNIMTIGNKIGKTEKAGELVDIFNKKMQNLKRSEKHPRVLMVLDRTYGTGDVGKCYVVGDGGIFAEPINLVGAINPYEGIIETPILTSEGIIKLNPDIIIDVINSENVKGDVTKDWMGLDINAVKKNNLYVLDSKKDTVPDERFYETVEKMSQIVLEAEKKL